MTKDGSDRSASNPRLIKAIVLERTGLPGVPLAFTISDAGGGRKRDLSGVPPPSGCRLGRQEPPGRSGSEFELEHNLETA